MEKFDIEEYYIIFWLIITSVNLIGFVNFNLIDMQTIITISYILNLIGTFISVSYLTYLLTVYFR